MSSNVRGGDVGQMRDLGGRMMQGATEVKGLVDQITNRIANVSWSGAVAQAFKQDWGGNFGPALTQASQEMETRGSDLLRHAAEQEHLSQRGR